MDNPTDNERQGKQLYADVIYTREAFVDAAQNARHGKAFKQARNAYLKAHTAYEQWKAQQ